MSSSPDSLALHILSRCGVGRALHAGCGSGELVSALLSLGADAYGFEPHPERLAQAEERLPGRVKSGDASSLPFERDEFAIVVVTDPAEWEGALPELRRVCRGALFLTLGEPGSKIAERESAAWKSRLIEAGFRRLPVSTPATPQHPFDVSSLVFEVAPDGAQSSPDDPLYSTSDAAEALIARYLKAAHYVRPNATVVEIDCGSGAGSYALRLASPALQVRGLDADLENVNRALALYGDCENGLCYEQSNGTLEPHSIDDLVVFTDRLSGGGSDWNSSLPAIRPGGRLILSGVGTEDIGSEAALRDTLSASNLLLEDCLVLDEAEHSWKPTSLQEALETRGVAWLATALRDPVEALDVPYREIAYPYTTPPPHLLQFEREYRDPWLLRSMVEFHFRTDNRGLNRSMAERVYGRERGTGTPDEAAALAVLGYQLLGKQVPAGEVEAMIGDIDLYQSQAKDTPHGLRWRISLRFLRALLLRKLGRLEDSERDFVAVLDTDPTPFSPTLGTKTVEAAYQAGVTALSLGRADDARDYWQRGVLAAERLLKVDWTEFVGRIENPLPFPLVVAAEFLDAATKCTRALIWTSPQNRRPPHDVFRQMNSSMQEWIKDRERWIAERDDLIRRLAEITRAQEKMIHDRDQWVAEREAWIQERNQEIERLGDITRMQEKLVHERDEWVADRDRWIAERDGWIQDRERWIKERDEIIAQLHGTLNTRDRAIVELTLKVQDLERSFKNRLVSFIRARLKR